MHLTLRLELVSVGELLREASELAGTEVVSDPLRETACLPLGGASGKASEEVSVAASGRQVLAASV